MLQVDTQYESYNIYWDPTLLTESSIQRNRLHIILAGSKKKITYINDIAVPKTDNTLNGTQQQNTEVSQISTCIPP